MNQKMYAAESASCREDELPPFATSAPASLVRSALVSPCRYPNVARAFQSALNEKSAPNARIAPRQASTALVWKLTIDRADTLQLTVRSNCLIVVAAERTFRAPCVNCRVKLRPCFRSPTSRAPTCD
jgi:hypothetical protein